jgi:hypothetical protein
MNSEDQQVLITNNMLWIQAAEYVNVVDDANGHFS